MVNEFKFIFVNSVFSTSSNTKRINHNISIQQKMKLYQNQTKSSAKINKTQNQTAETHFSV